MEMHTPVSKEAGGQTQESHMLSQGQLVCDIPFKIFKSSSCHKTLFIMIIFLCRVEGIQKKETRGKAEKTFYNRREVLVHFLFVK